MSHYFIEDPNLKNDFHEIRFTILERQYTFMSNSGVFSKDELDLGSKLLIEEIINMGLFGKVLDMGCGIGVIGLILAGYFPDAHFIMSDVNNRAIEVSNINKKRLSIENVDIIQSDIFSNINDKFNFIITNPPIRAGKKVVYAIFKQAYDHLEDDGALLIVIRKDQGALSALKYLETIFPSCSLIKRKKGYHIYKLCKS